MPNMVLTPAEQTALSSLIAAEPVPGHPLPERRVLELIDRLIPCDGIGGSYYAETGEVVESIDLPGGFLARLEQHDATCVADSLHIGFRNGSGNVVDLWLDRTGTTFDDRDVAMLAMLAPLLRRLVRERPTPHTAHLTVQERRVLMLVSGGLTNAEIAGRLSVAPCTVRKHLEHSYRKLGVTSRMGAIAALQGCDHPELDLRARLERFA